MVFRYFFKQKLHFLAMMCVKVCLHMFLLQINQINRIKHSESVSWKQKTRFVCNFHWKISFWSVFRWTQRSITQRRVITLGLIFVKMVLNRAQGLKKKSHEVSARKNNNRLRSNKKCRRGGGFRPPPGSFRVKATQMDCVYVTYFRLTNFSFYLIWARVNFFEVRLMVLSQKLNSKVLRMAIWLNYFDEKKAKWRLQCLKF